MTNANENNGQEETPKPGEAGADELDVNDNENPSEDGKNGRGKEGERPAETPSAKLARLDRERKQLLKKNPELDSNNQERAPKPDKKSELDYGQKAFLIASGIKEADEQALAGKIVAETGKTLEEVIAGPYFKAELKQLQEANAAAAAIPDSKRGNQTSPNSVDYWIAKGGLPPDTAENRKLRSDIVKARTAKEKGANVFSPTPVVGA